jgi:ribosome-binding ATPase YchF (GTP1/OBG family)
LIKAGYHLLGLQTYFTAGVQEVIDYLRDHGANEVIEVGGVKENTHL